MGDITTYLIKVVCASGLCAILNQMFHNKNTVSSVVKMISGIFIAVTVISPLIHVKIDPSMFSIDDYYQSGVAFSADGKQIAEVQKSEYIKEMTKAYISDKAASLGTELEVEVVLGNMKDVLIHSVTIRGDVSPYVKSQLSQILTDDLGIPKEAQLWKN